MCARRAQCATTRMTCFMAYFGPYRTDTASKLVVAGSVMLVGVSPITIVPDSFAYVPCSWFVSTVMRYVPGGTGLFWSSRPCHTSSYCPARRVARVTDANRLRSRLTQFQNVERSG